MNGTGAHDGQLATADGVPLKVALARVQRRSRRRAFLLVAPLLLFILIGPVGYFVREACFVTG